MISNLTFISALYNAAMSPAMSIIGVGIAGDIVIFAYGKKKRGNSMVAAIIAHSFALMLLTA